MDNLGQSIRNKREKRHMTVEELSQKTKISVAVLKDIEDGKFDRYTGDEAYVKMYLKKISNALDMDVDDVTQQYVALTQEIELAKLQEEEKREDHNEDVVKKGKEFTFKVPQLTRKPSVYEDQSHMNIIRAVIVLIIVCLIIVVFWYGFYSTRNATDDPEFKPQNQTTVEGNVGNDDNNNQDTPSSPQDNQDTPSSSQDAGITFTREKKLRYHFTLPEGVEDITFKIEFSAKSWASLKVNGRTYSEFEEKIYHNNDSEDFEVKEVTFKASEFKNLELKNGFSMGHRYYINGQQLPLDKEDESTGVTRLRLELDK